jgi:phage gp45-like
MSAEDRLHRRVQMATARVSISATDDSGPIHRAQVRVTPPETIDNVAVLQLFGFSSHAPVGSEAVAVFGLGDRSQAAIIATGNPSLRQRDLKSGEVALYDGTGNVVKLLNGGNIEITCAGPGSITINCPTKVRIVTPRLEVTGDVIDHCDDQAHTAANMREIYNSHTHPNVQNGPGSTGVPSQPQRETDE